MNPSTETHKKCGKCKKHKPLEFFNKDRTTASGFYGYCRECQRAKPYNPPKPKLTVAICETCSKEFTYGKKYSKGQRFCSSDCRPKRQADPDKKITQDCPICGKQFTCLKSWPQKTCSIQCFGKLQNPDAKRKSNCPECGKEFQWYASLPRKFCSLECARKGKNNPAWKGGSIDYYGPDWVSQRRKARKRDGYTCQHCGIHEKKLRRALDVHHIKPFRECRDYKEANRLNNLICLCPSCHHNAEHGKIPIQPSLPIGD